MKRKSILVIEDDVDFNGFLCRYLTLIGYQVTSVYSAEEALDALHYKTLPDVVISDVDLWDGDCTPILNLLEEPGYHHIPVILSSGYDFSFHDELAMARAQYFLPKPLSPRSLSRLVKSLVANAAAPALQQ
ncbi:MAG: response regulator [Anaerolineae bacterium]